MKENTQVTGVSLPVDIKVYEILFDSTDHGFALLQKVSDDQAQTSDFKYLKVNPAFERHLGLQNVVGKTIRELIPGVENGIMIHFNKVIDTGFKTHFEQFVPELDTSFAAEVFPTGTEGTIAVLFNNISKRKSIESKLRETEVRQTFLLKLSDALREVADAVKIQAIASQLLGEHLGANQVHYGETSGDVVIIHQGWGNGLPPMVGTFRHLDFGTRITEGYRTGRTQVSHDINADPTITQAERNVISGAGFNAYVAVPLIKADQWVSTLAVHTITPRKWKESEIELVEITAERTWAAVERARAEKALQENEQLLSAVFETLPVGVGLVNQEGALLMRNEEMHRFLPDGIIPSTDETASRQWHGWDEKGNLLDRQDFPGARALRGEYVVPGIEMLYTWGDVQGVWTQVASVPVKDHSGKIKGRVTVITDIDKIKRTAEALRKSELHFATFVSACSELIYHMSPNWKVMYTMNGKTFLREADQPIANWLDVYIPKEEQARVGASIEEAIREKKMFELEHMVIQADGEVGWTLSRAVPILDEEGNIEEWLGAASDITPRKMAEEQLRQFNIRLEQEVKERTAQLKESRDQLQSVFDTSLMQMSILEAIRDESGQVSDLKVKLVNKEHERVLGRMDLLGKHFVQEYPGMKQSGLFALIVKTIKTGKPQQTEYFYPYEGFNRWYAAMFVKLNDGVVAVNLDITRRKQVEELMRKMEAEQQLEIFRVSLSTVEEERHRISESLHNGLGQLLYGIKINLSGLSQNMPQKAFDGLNAYVNQLLTNAIQECRRISHELMPTILEDFGLKAAIGDICNQLQPGIKLNCITKGISIRMDKYLELAVYRTVQELLINVVKHAQASKVVIEVIGGPKQIKIRVTDNGVGIQALHEGRTGIGLASIRSKIKLLNGTVAIRSAIESGTSIEVVIPKPGFSC